MNIDVKSYNRQFLDTGKLVLDSDAAGNNALTKYGVRVAPAEVAPGEKYWKVIGIHHLFPSENRGDGHVYLEVLNEAGERIREPRAWVDNQFGDIHEPVPLDKPANEPAGNIPMFKANHKVRMRGLGINASDKGDTVENLHSDHLDEPLPADELGGNTRFHHSFYVVFQRTKKQAENGEEPISFLQFAVEHGLGNAVTPKFGFQQHQVQAFERGVVFARDDQPGTIKHLLW